MGTPTGVGPLLRGWREQRRLSQLALASGAGVSTRHLSFVETGRSRPSPELLLHLAAELQVPLRARNQLLLAAGYAPVYPERTLDDPEMAPVATVLDQVLERSEPNPTVIVDASWTLQRANAPALWLCSEVAPDLLEPPADLVRVALDPRGLAPHLRNLDEVAAHLLHRARLAAVTAGDESALARVDGLARELGHDQQPTADAESFALPMLVEVGGHELALFSTVATFGAPTEVTLSELSIETFYPADDATAEVLAARPWA